MNIKIIISALLLLPAGICTAQDKFKISGRLPAAPADRMVMLDYVNSEGKSVKDSALLTKGTFTISGATAFGNKAYIALLPVKKDTAQRYVQPDYQEFYLEKGTYKVSGTDSIANAAITGTQAQSDYLAYKKQMGTMPEQWRQIVRRAQKAMSAKDSAALKEIQVAARALRDSMEAALDAFIYSHPDSYVSLDLVYENKTSVIDLKVLNPYYTSLSKRVLGSFNGKKLTAKYEKAQQTSLGKAFDFTQEDVQGKPFKLSSLRGKYVLVDFWASWCAPCRAENPNVLKAYETLKDKNFEVVSISLDDNRNAWLKAVEKDGLPWTQVSDLKGWKNEVAVKYGITAVPQNILVDPKGMIIAKNLRGEDLTEQLETYIK